MKTKCFVFFLLLVVPFVFADNILDLDVKVEAGIIPLSSFMLYSPGEIVAGELPAYWLVNVRFTLVDIFFFGGELRSTFFHDEGRFFDTISIDYTVTLGFRLGEHIEIGFRHQCIHPAITYISPLDLSGRQLEGAYEELYIRFTGKINLF